MRVGSVCDPTSREPARTGSWLDDVADIIEDVLNGRGQACPGDVRSIALEFHAQDV